ncbi:galactokinase [Corynebacterium kroppenstedtii]|uniref:Galactokinase n=1 Tax=Corynebacterium kroppenstedtii (strain DSM 44385 / JCM 11950 / CIP 105744 / CCUG 35717) TaxID=645127 RepID=C4LGR2_CORK4|nr:galactokinase [Corynebacterium kroppenstedtii]ACR17017.1 Galactokinase [Corynebacterium kroppenstedtii DSM 44385]QRP09705.1 galactokinase [Corynebacterium kroppenstedtii]
MTDSHAEPKDQSQAKTSRTPHDPEAIRWAEARSDQQLIADATTLFTETFGGTPDGVWAAPGRVNLIGDHVDYAGGVSIPFALPHVTTVAARRRTDDTISIVSLPPGAATESGDAVTGVEDNSSSPTHPEALRTTVELADIGLGHPADWSGYVAGPIWAGHQNGVISSSNQHDNGLDLAIISDVPLGSGLSSSAALECSVALAARELAAPGQPLDQAAYQLLIDAAIRAENDVVGASTGGLDQRSSLLATAGHALAIDFRTNVVNQVACDVESDGLAFLVADTNAPHSLSDGQYASRRGVIDGVTSHAGASTLLDIDDPIAAATSWADTDESTVTPDVARVRVQHVIDETARTRRAQDALNSKNWKEFGRLMNESHESLRDLYDVSTPELNSARDAALDAGAVGARMTGGGFGGSIIALVPTDRITAVAQEIHQRTVDKKLPNPTFLAITPAAGARRLV